MQINSDYTSVTALPPAKCSNCGAEERRLLHHACHRGLFRRLCTSCVLRLFPDSFCPICFQVFPPKPSNDAGTMCSKCYSTSHSHCVPSPYQSPYVCPLCANPNSPVFQLKPPGEDNIDISSSEEWRVMDRDSAKMLLAAAKIAADTMTKAAIAAKAEAEKKAKEAALARRKARDALEHVRNLAEKEKMRKREEAEIGYLKRENNGGFVYGVNRNGLVGSNGAGPSSIVEERMNVDRFGNSNQVVDVMNGVEFRENNMNGPGNVDFGGNVDDDEDDDDVVLMDVDADVDADVDVDVDVDDSCVGRNDQGMISNGETDADNVIKIDRLGNGEELRANGTH